MNGANPDLPAPAAESVRQARLDLAGRLGIAPAGISIAQVEPVEWRDASLGLPRPGEFYAQVITPGYRIVLESGGTRYAYHGAGGRAVFAGAL
jgi:hypothetical protein